jgi:hypothetical protein
VRTSIRRADESRVAEHDSTAKPGFGGGMSVGRFDLISRGDDDQPG